MRLPEARLEWEVKGWKFGMNLAPGILMVGAWWDGNPYSFAIVLPFMHLWVEHEGGKYWPWDWTVLRIIIGKQEFRTDLSLNNWGLGINLQLTDDWSIHLGPLDIECEYDKFYDEDDEWIGTADLRLFSKVRKKCACEQSDDPGD